VRVDPGARRPAGLEVVAVTDTPPSNTPGPRRAPQRRVGAAITLRRPGWCLAGSTPCRTRWFRTSRFTRSRDTPAPPTRGAQRPCGGGGRCDHYGRVVPLKAPSARRGVRCSSATYAVARRQHVRPVPANRERMTRCPASSVRSPRVTSRRLS
jgi:hypothetical protein